MKHACLIALWFVFSSHAWAELHKTASLEWLADSSADIGIYVLSAIDNQSESGCQLTLHLKKTLKGNPPSSTQSGYPLRPPNNLPGTTVALRDRFLMFSGSEHGLINLTAPQPYDESVAAVTVRGEVLTDGAKILRVVKERLRAHPTEGPVRLEQRISVDGDDVKYSYPHSFFCAPTLDSWMILVPRDLAPEWTLPGSTAKNPHDEEEEVIQPLVR